MELGLKKKVHAQELLRSCARTRSLLAQVVGGKMRKSALLIAIACTLFSCDNEIYSPIPDAPISFRLDLSALDADLVPGLACKTFTQKRNESDRMGFGGFLIINGFGSKDINLYAYDLTCPVECSIKIKVEPNDVGEARCPVCGSVFYIADGIGSPKKGSDSKYGLKIYPVIQQGGQRYLISR